MSANLHLAGPDDLTRLLPLVEAFHAEQSINSTPESREAGIAPLLQDSPLGCAYLIGPTRAPLGYVVITFGWSVEFGGLDAFIDELYLRPAVRGRGIATTLLTDLPKALSGAGLRALHLEVDRNNDAAQRLYARCGFRARDRYHLMSKPM